MSKQKRMLIPTSKTTICSANEWAIPGLFFRLFLYFQTHITIFTTNLCEKSPPVYGAGIQTHDLQDMSLLPKPIDMG